MLTSLALIFLVGLALAALCQKLKLPRIIGMLATGILLGPCVLNVLDGSILSISADLRKLALVIILLKAGLSLDLGDLKKVGRPAILMSCLPATCEIIGYVLLAPCFLGITRVEAAVMGAVLAAVSPAVVVPRMVQLMESGRGTDKSIPQMILAGASCDDIFVIVLFTTFLHTAQGGSANAADFSRRCAGCACRVVVQPLFRDCLCPIALHPQQHEGHHRAGGLAAARRGGGLARGHRAGVGPARGRQHGVLT